MIPSVKALHRLRPLTARSLSLATVPRPSSRTQFLQDIKTSPQSAINPATSVRRFHGGHSLFQRVNLAAVLPSMSNLQSVLNMSPRRDISITAASASGLVKTSTQQSRKFSDDRTHPPKPDNKDDGNADEQSFAAKCVDVAFQISMFLLPFQLWGLAYLRREGPKFRKELKLQIVDAHNFEAELQNQIRFMKERAESDGEHSHYLELKRDELGNILEDEFEMSALTYAERIAELEESLETVKASRKTLEEIDNSFSVRIFSEPIPFIGDLGTI